MIYENGKRYYSLNSYLKKTFNCKVYKIALDGGMTCPNRDGTLGTDGCIFCLDGSGEFAAKMQNEESIFRQIEEGKQRLQSKLGTHPVKYIAYFQAYTNTYAKIECRFVKHIGE